MIPQITYGDRLRRVRLDQGLNQEQFAAEVGADRAQIARHELMTVPPQRNRRALAAMVELRYGVPSEWLLTGDTHEYHDTVVPVLTRDDVDLAA